MEKKPRIEQKQNEKWENWHKTLDVGGKTQKTLMPFNEYENGAPPQGREFVAGLAGLQAIIKEAQNDGRRVRAHGSGWSLNNIAFTDEFLVSSNNLNYVKVGISAEYLTDKYKDKSRLLTFAQCGLMVKQLNIAIQKEKLSLPTSGASDGQRIVGAITTGTHGSAHLVGAMTEFVRGIHLVILDKHVYLQRASDQAVTSAFGVWLDGAEIINDDDMFNAALVGFGGFGLIHGLMLETEPEYYLERVIRNYHISEVRNAITTWDFTGLDLPQGNTMPFHFECVLNPYPIQETEKGAFVRIYYRHNSLDNDLVQSSPASDTPDIHTGIAEHFDDDKAEEFRKLEESRSDKVSDDIEKRARWIGFLMQLALKFSFPTTTPENPIRVPSKWFTGDNSADPQTNSPVPATSLELGIPFDRIGDALDLFFEVTKLHPFAAPFAFRYVKRSSATLGFTGIADVTVTIEMPGPFGRIFFRRTGEAHAALFKALEESGIPHSFHWGQQFPKNTSWVKKTYGDAAVEQWKAQRKKLLGDVGAKMFSNTPMEDIGLAGIPILIFFSRLWKSITWLFTFWKKPSQARA